jgi:Ca2+-binding RTX toxin-like protein
VGNVTLDLNGMEQINVVALGGADNITVHDLSGTDVKQVHVDLAAPPGSGTGDGQADTVNVEGTAGNDKVKLTGSAAETIVSGLAAETHVTGADSSSTVSDTVHVAGGEGDDLIDASAVIAGGPTLILDGGAGDDTLIGNGGHVIFDGGSGNNTIVNFDAAKDQLDLRSLGGGHTADWVLAQGHDVDGNVMFDFGDQQLTLTHETLASLTAGDFLLA